MIDNVTISPVAEDAILLTWPEIVSPHIQQKIGELSRQLNASNNVIECVSSYNSLMVYYQFTAIKTEQLIERIGQMLNSTNACSTNAKNQTPIDIPVFYHDYDLATVAKTTQLSQQEVIHLHCNTTYTAYAHGFTPGFCYLATTAKRLQLPRKASPRTKVPAGAVAIAEQQTAVYPFQTPGGWHILGLTPRPLFQIENQQFKPLISLGQSVRFRAISQHEYQTLLSSYHRQ